MERLRHAGANQLHILFAAPAFAGQILEAITIRRAVSVRDANQNVLRRDFLHGGADLVAQRGGKPEKVRADNSHQGSLLLQHQGPHGQVALHPGSHTARAYSPAERQQRVRVDVAHGDPGAQARKGIGVRDNEH